MKNHRLNPLKIGDLEIYPPIIQGGMGVRISRSRLASAVANQGCIGVIAGVGLGKFEELPASQFIKINEDALRNEIRKARGLTKGIIGVNLMVALSNYESLLRVADKEGIDIIISGAGLPLKLPGLVTNSRTKLIPIISSVRALKIICRKWEREYSRLPDAVIVEGVKAGGHLGYAHEDVVNESAVRLEDIVSEVIDYARTFSVPIPVIAAGGIFDGSDIARFLKLGASGVQIGTRFVCTDECDAHDTFKQAYLDAGKEDITVIKSPVGMPGRVIVNDFVKRIKEGETVPFTCRYHCLKSCNPKTAPYCIARALTNAAEGRMEEAFVFSGSNSYRCTEIIPVKDLINTLVEEAQQAMNSES